MTLLYVDGTDVFAADPVTFQRNLNIFLAYTELWRLEINYKKTKVMTFGIRDIENFRCEMAGNVIELEYMFITIFSIKKSKLKCIFIPSIEIVWPLDCAYSFIRVRALEIRECRYYQKQLHNEFLCCIIHLRKSKPIYVLQAELARHNLQDIVKLKNILNTGSLLWMVN